MKRPTVLNRQRKKLSTDPGAQLRGHYFLYINQYSNREPKVANFYRGICPILDVRRQARFGTCAFEFLTLQPLRFCEPPTYAHVQEKVQLQYEVDRLTKFKAEFENLAESSLNGSDSDGWKGGDGGGSAAAGCGDGKWKQQAKRLQKYAKWQLAEAENEVKKRFVVGENKSGISS